MAQGSTPMSEAVGVIVAAIIAGFVAFFSLIISKEQTVSDFRQQWIDELRKDIAAVASCVSSIQGDSIAKPKSDQEQPWKAVKEDFVRFKELIVRIRLRLNPKETRKTEGPATKGVLKALEKLESIFASPAPEFDKVDGLVDTLVTNTNIILKENWKRVRSGETVYQITKWTALVFTIAVFIASLLHVLKLI